MIKISARTSHFHSVIPASRIGDESKKKDIGIDEIKEAEFIAKVCLNCKKKKCIGSKACFRKHLEEERNLEKMSKYQNADKKEIQREISEAQKRVNEYKKGIEELEKHKTKQ